MPALVVIAPWSAYASRWEGRFVPLATGSGTSLFVGTYLPGGGSTYGAKLALADEVRRRHPRLRGVPAPRLPGPLVFETVAARHPGLHPDAALAREARRNVARAVRHEPAAFARLLLSKPVKLWWGYSEGPRRPDPAAAVAVHRVLLVVSVLLLGAGALLTRQPMLIACALVLLAVTAQHALLLALPRYGFPLLPVLYAGRRPRSAVGQVEPERQAERRHEDQPDPGGDQRLGLVDVADRAHEEARRHQDDERDGRGIEGGQRHGAASIPQFLDS